MRMLKMSILSLAVMSCFIAYFAESADAQIFRRNVQRTRSVQACPGGVCPQANVTQSVQVTRTAGQWSYPGKLDEHLQNDHGVSAYGMSRKQMLDTHNALHEGRSIRKAAAPAAPVAPRLPTRRTWADVTPSSQGSPQPTLAPALFGLSALEIVEPTTVPSHVLAQVDEPGPREVATENFRSSLLKAVVEARKNGKINFRDSVKLRVASLSPAFVERAQELAVAQIAFSGEESGAVPIGEDGVVQVDGINWDGLAKFLEAILPLILSLLKAFGV